MPPQTLDVCVAQTQGSMGFLLELAFDNELPRAGFRKQVVTILTQVEVDAADPASSSRPSRSGRSSRKDRAEILQKTAGWTMVEDSGAGGARSSRPPSPGKCAASRSPRR